MAAFRIGAIVTKARLLLFIADRRDFQNVVEFEIANFAEENFNLKLNTVPRKTLLNLIVQTRTFPFVELSVIQSSQDLRKLYSSAFSNLLL